MSHGQHKIPTHDVPADEVLIGRRHLLRERPQIQRRHAIHFLDLTKVSGSPIEYRTARGKEMEE